MILPILIDTDTNDARVREVYEATTPDATEVYRVKLHTVATENGRTQISASLVGDDGKALLQDDGTPYILPNPMHVTVADGTSPEMADAMLATIKPAVIARAVVLAQADDAVSPIRAPSPLKASSLSAVPVSMLTSDHGGGSLTIAPAENTATEAGIAQIDSL